MTQKDYSLSRRRQSRQVRPKKGWKNKIYLIIILISFFWQFYFFIFSDFFKIKEIQITGHKYIREKAILTLVQALLKEKLFSILPQNNIFLFPKTEIESLLRSKVSLEAIKIDRDFPVRLKIILKEKTSRLIWFEENRYYYLDREGVVIQEITQKALLSSFPLVQEIKEERLTKKREDQEGINLYIPSLKPGGKMISEKQVKTILEIYKTLPQESKIEPEIFLVNRKRQNEIRLKTKEDFEIYFSCEELLSRQLENLVLALKDKIKGERENLEYIDLRIGDRVYYKFKIQN